MDTFASITETDVFTVLRSYVTSLVGCPVVRSPVNRVAMPVGDFILLSPLSIEHISLNVHTYSATQTTILRPLKYTVQVDCLGTEANDRAITLSSMFRDSYTAELFAASGFDIAPLFTTELRQLPFVSGEDQYIERWTFDCAMQVNAVITLTTQAANTLSTVLLEVDATYPPS
jgi:hypothetical protein